MANRVVLTAALALIAGLLSNPALAEKKPTMTRGQAIQTCREELGRGRAEAAMVACVQQKLASQSSTRR